MRWFANLNVGTKLIAAFTLLSFFCLAVGLVGVSNMSQINGLAESMYEQELLGLSAVKEANINLIYMGRARLRFLLADTVEERQRQRAAVRQSGDTLAALLNQARPLFTSELSAKNFAEIDAAFSTYRSNMERSLGIAGEQPLPPSDPTQADLQKALRTDSQRLDDLMTELTQRKEGNAKDSAQLTGALYHSSRAVMLVLIAAAVLAGIVIGQLITRGLLRQLGGEPREAGAIARRIAAGDLSVAVVTHARDRSSMLFAIKGMRDSLAEIVSQVRSGTQNITAAATEIAAGNQDLSTRTEQQASALEETASSMEELTGTVQQNAEHARRANAMAQAASDIAEQGGAAVSKVAATMGQINDSSKRIVNIISVIDGIAFQTNILALNAAVEAARAGEQGRGFAVVAGEVRSLAHRSATAAKEIKDLIESSVSSAATGSDLVSDASATLARVVERVRQVTDFMGQISHASEEQSEGIEQINEAVNQMDQVTQQNAALVEESAAAADALRQQAHALNKIVSIFRLEATPDEPALRLAPVAVP